MTAPWHLRFLGTGNARQVPVYGCACVACARARQEPARQRRACSALLEADGFRLMLDAGRTDLCDRFAPGALDAVLLTHYHMDHVMGLFLLRWGTGMTLPVYGPDDPQGCDDLYKHPGILAFQSPMIAFETVRIGPWRITPLPLNHSRLTLGYLIEAHGRRLAYLTDTLGLPEATRTHLQRLTPDVLVLDCSMPPKNDMPSNHNDLTRALETVEAIRPGQTWLTHIGHQLDAYWMVQPELPEGVYSAVDEGVIAV
ncbi:MAG: phosphonate metabolism protein PhnP [Gammaproteobacteria bacterium]|nr:phosphonate metabolism protein PhnP [Gammaproteobacteria bacterium]